MPQAAEPVIIVFDSRSQKQRRKHDRKYAKLPTTLPTKSFAFINTSDMHGQDEDSRRLIKTHAMQDVLRRRSQKLSRPQMESEDNSVAAQDATPISRSSPHAPLSSCLIFPIKTEPYMHKLIHNCMWACLFSRTRSYT